MSPPQQKLNLETISTELMVQILNSLPDVSSLKALT